MISMTGYGKAVSSSQSREIVVELKSVNHRFLDISTKMPRSFIAYDSLIKETIGKFVSRGHVDVFINYTVNADEKKKISVDLGLAKSYLDAAKKLEEEFDLKNDFGLVHLMRTNDVIVVEEQEDDVEEIATLLKTALTEACQSLNKMRQAEGDRLEKVISNHVDNIEKYALQIKEFAPCVVQDFRAKIEARIKEVLSNVEIDQQRLLNEVAFYADKSNIDEEIARLFAHIEHCRNLIKEQTAGRKLDFLIQELNRETNTICSKSGNVGLTDVALKVKNEIEKLREQIQNIE